MDNLERPVRDFAETAKEYAEAVADDVKLRSTEGLATAFNKIFSMLAVLMTASVALVCIAFGLVLMLGELIGNYAAGAFIIGGVFVVATGIMYLFRNKMFINSFVRLFIQIFYDRH